MTQRTVYTVEEKERIGRMLHSAQEEERLQGLKALRCSGMENDPGLVCQALGDESWRVRKEAVSLFLESPQAAALAGEVIELLHAQENAGLRNAAVDILVRLGYQAVPLLLEELSCSDHDVRKFVLDILGDIGDVTCVPSLLPALSDPDENVRAAAAENLGKLRAAEAVPMLLEAMNQADLWMRFTILEALARIGQAVPVARLLVFADEKLLRKALFDCLGRIGGMDAVPALIRGLTDEMRNAREAALVALDRIAESSPGALDEALSALAGTAAAEAVAASLESSDPTLVRAAVRTLHGMRDARFASRLLAVFENELLRNEAAAALIAMGHPAACSLLEQWPAADGRMRAYLAYIFGESRCVEAFAQLRAGLNAGDPELQLVCAQALGKLGVEAAIAPLVETLCLTNDEVRQAAMQALCRLTDTHPQEVLPRLLHLLADDDAELRMQVVTILGQMDSSEVEGPLAFAMKDESPLVRRAAVRACERHTGEKQLSTLMLALTDEDAEVRRLAVESLGLTGNRQAIPPLELALQDEDIWVRAAAVRSLGRLGGEDVFPLIGRALQDPVGLVAIAALEALNELDAVRACPAMVHSLHHPDEEVINAALHQLAASGQRGWLPAAIEPLLNHRHWEVRSTFVRTLASLQGAACRPLLEARLLIEGEELVRQLIQDVLADFREFRG
jgi:HEAT repeat protein